MSTSRDDDAFRWEGDADPTLDAGGSTGGESAAGEAAAAHDTGTVGAGEVAPGLPAGYTAVGKGSAPVPAVPSADAAADGGEAGGQSASIGNAALVALGVLGGIYGLFTLGWIFGGLRLQGVAQYLVADVMFQGSFWLAVLAPALWFATTWLLTATSRAWVRFVWLAAGAVLLLPWPFVMIGAVGQ
ncbi:DNA polymerase III subunit gamma/tau [Microbacterium hominis]|uniref:DNA polymerase III subunit gamma/tau n=1 Tax=Microbacterium hominis TaxID=162426 RepID=A0A7D4UB72_9MICO|nr:DNA polymerase III subunit gamma/tau [Microbacterium hominis]QKJ19223.1 DNA polymerase III subunit gamma/tau [Microbacterium hominis]